MKFGDSWRPSVFIGYRNSATGEVKVFRTGRSWLGTLLGAGWALWHGFPRAAFIGLVPIGLAIVGAAMKWEQLQDAIWAYWLAGLWIGGEGNRWLIERALARWQSDGVVQLWADRAASVEEAMAATQHAAQQQDAFIQSLSIQPPEVIAQALGILRDRSIG